MKETLRVGGVLSTNGVLAFVGQMVGTPSTFLGPALVAVQIVVAVVTVVYVGLKAYSVYLDVRKKRQGKSAPEQD